MIIKQQDPIRLFHIQKGDCISLTGAGGKTGMMFFLASQLKKGGSVLLAPSTKIRVPDRDIDFLYTDPVSLLRDLEGGLLQDFPHALVCMGRRVVGRNKLRSPGYEWVKKIRQHFTYTLLEADGSRQLPLKFWHPYEPVIYDFSTIVIGILSIKPYGEKPGPNQVYHYEGWREWIGKEAVPDRIDAGVYVPLIRYQKGLFKDFSGKKILWINQVESEEDRKHCQEIMLALDQGKWDPSIQRTGGSIKEGCFYEYSSDCHGFGPVQTDGRQ